jgi:hypothetical protein
MKKVIHINQHNTRHNIKCLPSERKPVITCKDYKSNDYFNELNIYHCGVVVAKLVYSPDKPLSCGARIWIECETEVVEIKGVV